MFIDTNVFVRARMEGAPGHHAARSRLKHAMGAGERISISRQVIREYLAVVTRGQDWSPPLPLGDALDSVHWMASTFVILEDGPEVTEALIALCREVPVGGRQIHDANIVATMVANREFRLLTFNPADFRRYGARVTLV